MNVQNISGIAARIAPVQKNLTNTAAANDLNVQNSLMSKEASQALKNTAMAGISFKVSSKEETLEQMKDAIDEAQAEKAGLENFVIRHQKEYGNALKAQSERAELFFQKQNNNADGNIYDENEINPSKTDTSGFADVDFVDEYESAKQRINVLRNLINCLKPQIEELERQISEGK